MLTRKNGGAAPPEGAAPVGAATRTGSSHSESYWSRFLRALLRALAAVAT
jgi:hypothetical protein